MRLFAVVSLLLLLAGCASQTPQANSTPKDDPKATGASQSDTAKRRQIPVQAAKVEQRDVQETFELTGTTRIWEEYSVSAEITGRIIALHFDEGDWIKTGQVMAELDRDKRRLELANRKAQLKKAEVELSFARKNLDRLRTLLERGVVSQSEVDGLEEAAKLAESAVDLAQISIQVMEEEIEDTSVRAPAGGEVSRRLVSLGENASAGSPMFIVVQYNPIKVVSEVPEADFFRMNRREPVWMTFDALPNQRIKGLIHRVDSVANTQSGAFRVEVKVPNPGHRLQAGMVARLEVKGPLHVDALVAPMDAVLEGEEGTVVFRIQGETAEKIPVAVGYRFGDAAIVEGGIEPGDLVVTRGNVNLTDGTPVKIAESTGEPLRR